MSGILLENPRRRGRRRGRKSRRRMSAAQRRYFGPRSNPAPARRRRRRRSSSRRRRSNPGNPAPRRRRSSRRRSRRSNPFRIPGLGGTGKVIGTAVGMIAAEFAGDFLVQVASKHLGGSLAKMLPGNISEQGVLRVGIGLAGAWAMKRFGGSVGRRYADTFRTTNVFFGIWYLAGGFGLPRGSTVALKSGLGDYARVGIGSLPGGEAYGMLGAAPQLYDYAVSRDDGYTGLPEYAS